MVRVIAGFLKWVSLVIFPFKIVPGHTYRMMSYMIWNKETCSTQFPALNWTIHPRWHVLLCTNKISHFLFNQKLKKIISSIKKSKKWKQEYSLITQETNQTIIRRLSLVPHIFTLAQKDFSSQQLLWNLYGIITSSVESYHIMNFLK